ncbi:Aldo/keto reductase [Nemania serpens]|nr:Aldo/keto reductase [Nemania serpens]
MQSTVASKANSAGTDAGSGRSGGIPSLKLNDGHEIPMLAYGLGTARSREESENVIKLTVMAIKNGYYHLDCAESYKNETELGAAIKQSGIPRDKLFITTKLQSTRADVAASFAASLARLDLSYVDLYLIHSPFGAPSPSHLQETWASLEAIKASGRARSIGVSNFSTSDLTTILATARVPPALNQIEYHPYLQHNTTPDGVLAFCRERDIALAAYGPLTAITRARPGPCDAVYAALARRYGVSEAAVALRWCLDQDVVAVTTSASEERLSGYMNEVPAFRLAEEEVAEIAAEGEKMHFRGYWKSVFAADDRR